MAFRFRLFLENGEDVGEFATAVPNWSIGDQLINRDHNRFEVTNLVAFEEPGDFHGILVVTPLELAEPA